MTRFRFTAGLVLGLALALAVPAVAAISTKSLLPALRSLPTVALPSVGTEGYLSLRVDSSGAPTLVRVLGGLGDSQKTQVVNATVSGTYTPDASLGTYFKLTLTGNTTIAAPTNLKIGQVIEFELIQDGTGGRTVTWNAAYHFGTAWSNTGNTAGLVSMVRAVASTASLLRIGAQTAYAS